MDIWRQQIESIRRTAERNAMLAAMPAGGRAMFERGEMTRRAITDALSTLGPLTIREIAEEIGQGKESTRNQLILMLEDKLVIRGARNKPWRLAETLDNPK